MTDAHTRQLAEPLISSPSMTTNVTRMTTGPAESAASSGTLFRLSKTTGTKVSISRIRIAPFIVGVMSRRNTAMRSDTMI